MAVRVRPIAKGTKNGRVDQGVDFEQTTPYVAIGAGTVVRVSPPGTWWNPRGSGMAVYVKLDKPISVNGRTYSEVYYAEQDALVKQGQRVKAGQPVMAGGGAEIGFAANGAPVGKLVGGVGAGTQPTSAGQDFLDFLNGKSSGPSVKPTSANAPGGQPNQQSQSSGIVPPTPVPSPTDTSQIGATGVQMPGSVNYQIDPNHVSSLWQTVANSSFVSPETTQMVQNAQLAAGTV